MLKVSFSTFHLQWILWTIPEQGAASRSVISEHAAAQLIRDLKLSNQECLEDRDEDSGNLLGFDVYFKA